METNFVRFLAPDDVAWAVYRSLRAEDDMVKIRAVISALDGKTAKQVLQLFVAIEAK